jgi:hypothetical protein
MTGNNAALRTRGAKQQLRTRGAGEAPGPVPGWLRFVLISDRAGSAWYVGTGFFFAPLLAVLSPWPAVTTVLWVLIALAGLWLGLLGVAMAAGLTMILRSDAEIPEDYWWSLLGGKPSAR